MMINIQVKPNSKNGPLIEKLEDGSFRAYVREPAIEDKANYAVLNLVADYFSVAKSQVSFRAGTRGRQKVVSIDLD